MIIIKPKTNLLLPFLSYNMINVALVLFLLCATVQKKKNKKRDKEWLSLGSAPPPPETSKGEKRNSAVKIFYLKQHFLGGILYQQRLKGKVRM